MAEKSPERWAFDLSIVLKSALGEVRFPVDVASLAVKFSAQKFPNDRVTKVRFRDLSGFEGVLTSHPRGKPEWGIGYAEHIKSEGRRWFTVAHEFGHYLLHREKYPNGFKCRPEDIAKWDSEYNRVESEANRFAATLMMPTDDFRLQIPP